MYPVVYSYVTSFFKTRFNKFHSKAQHYYYNKCIVINNDINIIITCSYKNKKQGHATINLNLATSLPNLSNLCKIGVTSMNTLDIKNHV